MCAALAFTHAQNYTWNYTIPSTIPGQLIVVECTYKLRTLYRQLLASYVAGCIRNYISR